MAGKDGKKLSKHDISERLKIEADNDVALKVEGIESKADKEKIVLKGIIIFYLNYILTHYIDHYLTNINTEKNLFFQISLNRERRFAPRDSCKK